MGVVIRLLLCDIMEEKGEKDFADTNTKMTVPEPVKNGLKSWGIATMLMLGLVIVFGMRCNVGVAIVMVLSSGSEEAAYAWTPDQISNVDQSFFWGHKLTQLLGGILVTYFLKPNIVFGVSVLLTSL